MSSLPWKTVSISLIDAAGNKHAVKYLAVVDSSLEQHVELGVGRTFLPIQSKNKHKEYKKYVPEKLENEKYESNFPAQPRDVSPLS